MPEGTEGQAVQEDGEAQQTQQQTTPPWEANGERFDPERAWRLIQDLRGERDGLRTERETLQGRVSEFEQANQTDAERLTQRAETAEARIPTLEQENNRLRAAMQVGLDPELIDRLRGDTLEDLVQDAKSLQQRMGPPAAQRFAHGARQSSAPGSMNDLIAGAIRR